MNKEVEMLESVDNITNVTMANVDMKDYPDFVDAYVEYAEWEDTGLPLTDEELDNLNENEHEFKQEEAHKSLF